MCGRYKYVCIFLVTSPVELTGKMAEFYIVAELLELFRLRITLPCPESPMWQNRLNYSGSSALVLT
jgi:hypothetical protein